MKSRRFSATRIILAAAVLLVVMQPPASPASVVGVSPQVWVVTSGTARVMTAGAPRVASRLLKSPPSVVLGFDADHGRTTALSWSSEATFELMLRAGYIPASTRYVMYDPENWPSTPLREQRDPVAAMDRFAATARAHGYKVILTPHPSLVTVPGGRCTVQPGESPEAAYIRCDIVGHAAAVADIVETQAQYLEADPLQYADFVSATAAQARAANPDVLVISGLSTNFVASPVELYAAWASVQGVVDGHYLALPGGRGYSVALKFLRLLPH